MVVGIIGGGPQHYQLAFNFLNNLIEEKQIYLFNIFTGYIGEPSSSLSYIIAEELGAPHIIKKYDTLDKLIHGICYHVDYLIVLNDNSQPIKRCFMAFQQTGKHGSMIKI